MSWRSNCVVLLVALLLAMVTGSTDADAQRSRRGSTVGGTNPVCANADPTSFDQVYACMTWANENGPNRFAGNIATSDCRSISSTYIAVLQQGGGMSRADAVGRTPRCEIFARAVEKMTGKPAFWSSCLGYGQKPVDVHIKECLEGFVAGYYGARAPVHSRIKDCAQAVSQYEFALMKADGAAKLPAGYGKPGCELASRLIAEWSQIASTSPRPPARQPTAAPRGTPQPRSVPPAAPRGTPQPGSAPTSGQSQPTKGRRGGEVVPAAPTAPREPDLVCDYWGKVELSAWDAEMDRMYETFKGIEVTKEEVESAWQMDYERAKARWPGNDAQARNMTRPRRTLRIFLRREKYSVRHSRELTDDEVRHYMRLVPTTSEEDIREKISDLSFKINMARYSACRCDCGGPKMKEICTYGVYYHNDRARIYVPHRWRQRACFDESLLPDDAMEP